MPTSSRAYRLNRVKTLKAEFDPKTPCENCGSRENLEWDHVDPTTKSFNVMDGCHKLFRRSRIVAEIAKCRVLCGHCNTLRANAKHSDELVRQVRNATGLQREIAARFSVSPSFVSRVRSGKRRNIKWSLD